jgi:hypothetical protein
MLTRLPLALVVCLGIVLFASGSEASDSDHISRRAEFGLGQGAPARSALAPRPGAPSFALAARNGVKQLIGLGGPSPVSQQADGLWGGHTLPNWWESALALLALTRYVERTHSTQPIYQRAILKLYHHNVVRPGTHAPLNFGNEFNDDTGWWGVAWLEAARYELYVRHDMTYATKFLNVAEWDANFISAQSRRCGGIEWGMGKPPDTITMAEFLSLTAGLYSLRNAASSPFHDAAKAAHWRADTMWGWGWLRHSKLINVKIGRVYDKLLPGSCKRWGGPLTYSEGWVAEALVKMAVAFHSPTYFRYAKAFLHYAVTPTDGLIQNGIIREKCEAGDRSCKGLKTTLDIPAWKGLLVNALSDWDAATGRKTFEPVIRAQATAIVNDSILVEVRHRCASPNTCLFSQFWIQPKDYGAWTPEATVGGQESAIDALTAALPSRDLLAARP